MCAFANNRRSGYVACLALNPLVPSSHSSHSHTHAHMQQLPINHITLIHTHTSAIESVSCAVIAGRDHHSDECVSHLELACYQHAPDTSSSGGGQQQQMCVEQLYVPLAQLYQHDVVTALAQAQAQAQAHVTHTHAQTQPQPHTPLPIANSVNVNSLFGAPLSQPPPPSNANLMLSPTSLQQMNVNAAKPPTSARRPSPTPASKASGKVMYFSFCCALFEVKLTPFSTQAVAIPTLLTRPTL